MFLIGGRTLGGEYIDSFGVALDTWMKQSNSRKYLPRHYHHRGPPLPPQIYNTRNGRAHDLGSRVACRWTHHQRTALAD